MAQDPNCGTCADLDEACDLQDALDDANTRIAELEKELEEVKAENAGHVDRRNTEADLLRDIAERLEP